MIVKNSILAAQFVSTVVKTQQWSPAVYSGLPRFTADHKYFFIPTDRGLLPDMKKSPVRGSFLLRLLPELGSGRSPESNDGRRGGATEKAGPHLHHSEPEIEEIVAVPARYVVSRQP